MAENIKGITVVLGADTTALGKALSDVNKKSRDIQKELKEVDKLLKLDPGNTELVAQKQQLLSDAVANTSEKLDRLKRVQNQVNEQFRKGEISEGQYRAFQREIAKTEQELSKFNSELGKVPETSKKASKSLSETGESLGKLGDKMTKIGAGMTAGLTAPILGAGAALTKLAADSEAATSKMSASLGLSAEEAEKLTNVSRGIWERGFGESLDEVNQALIKTRTNIQDLNDEDLEKLTQHALTLAEVFDADVSETTRTASVMMKNFGISGEEAFDLMTKGFQLGGDFSGELLDTLREYAPQFKAMGISAEDAMGMLIKGAENGAFNLDKVGDAIKEFNIRIKDDSKSTHEALALLGASNVFDDLAKGAITGQDALVGVIQKLRELENPIAQNSIGVALFGTQWEDLEKDVVLALDAGIGSLNEFEGATQSAGDAMRDSFKSDLVEFWRQLQTEIMPFAQTLLSIAKDIAPPFIAFISSIASLFAELSPVMQVVVTVLGGLLAAIGPIIVIIGQLASGISSIIGFFSSMSAAVTAAGGASSVFGSVLAALTGPIGIAVAAITGIVTTLTVLYKKNETVRNFMNETWAKIVETFKQAWQAILDFVMPLVEDFKKVVADGLGKIKALWDEHGELIMAAIKPLLIGLVGFFKVQFEAIKMVISTAWTIIKATITTVWETIKLVVSTALDLVIGIIDVAMKLIKGDWSGAWESIKKTAENIMNNILKFFKNINLVQVGKDIINGLIKGISSMASAAIDTVKDVANDLVGGVKKALGIKSPSRVMMGVGEDTGEGLAVGIENKKKRVVKSAEDLAKEAYNASKEWIDERKYYSELSLEEELAAWNRIAKRYKEGSEQRKAADREVYRVQQEILKNQQQSEKEAFDKSKKWINEKKELSMLSLTQELAAWERVQERYAEGTEERKQAEKEAARVRQEIYNELQSASDDYLAKVKEVNSRVAEEEKRLNEVYEQALESRTKSIYSFAGLFDEVTRNTEVSGQQLIDNLRGQVNVMAEWAASLEQLAARGVDDGLISELEQMGPKAAAEIAALNSLTDDELNEYQFLWKSKNQLAREQAVEELEGLKNETVQKIQELNKNAAIELDNLQKEFEKRIKAISTGTKTEFNALAADMPMIGNEIINGLIKGMDGMKGELQKKAAEIANSVSSAIKSALDINSPSKVTEQLGKWTGEGLVVGMKNTVNAIHNQANKLASAAVPNMQQSTSGSTAAGMSVNLQGFMSGAVFNVRTNEDIDAIAEALYRKFNNSLRGAGIRG